MNDGAYTITTEQAARNQRDEADIAAAQAIDAVVITELRARIEQYQAARNYGRQISSGVAAETVRAILAADKRSPSPDPALRTARTRIEQADAIYWGVVARWGDLPRKLAARWSRKAPVGCTWSIDDLAGAAVIGMHRGLLRYERDGGSSPRTWAARWAESYAQRDDSSMGDLSAPRAVQGGFSRPASLRVARLDAPLPGRDGRADTLLRDMVAAPDEADIGEAIDLRHARDGLMRRIEALPARHRIAFRRSKLDGAPLVEIADEMGCSRERVRQLVIEAASRLGSDVQAAIAQPAPPPPPVPPAPSPPRRKQINPAIYARIEADIIAAIAAHPGELNGIGIKHLVGGSSDTLCAVTRRLISAGRIRHVGASSRSPFILTQEPPCLAAAPSHHTDALLVPSPVVSPQPPPPISAAIPTTAIPAVPVSASSARATSSAAGSGEVVAPRAARARVRRSGIMDRVAAALAAEPTLTSAQIAARVGASPHAVGGAITYLRREGALSAEVTAAQPLDDQVLRLIRVSPGITISDMNRLTGALNNTVRATVSRLRQRGLVQPAEDRTGRCYPAPYPQEPPMPDTAPPPIERTLDAAPIIDALGLDPDADLDAVTQAISEIAEAAAGADRVTAELRAVRADVARLTAQTTVLTRERDALRHDLSRAHSRCDDLSAADRRPVRSLSEADLDARYSALAEARRLYEAADTFRREAVAWGHMGADEIEMVVGRRVQQADTLRRLALTGTS
jgi:RNA polymerase sigma factor (sigma-70 family)